MTPINILALLYPIGSFPRGACRGPYGWPPGPVVSLVGASLVAIGVLMLSRDAIRGQKSRAVILLDHPKVGPDAAGPVVASGRVVGGEIVRHPFSVREAVWLEEKVEVSSEGIPGNWTALLDRRHHQPFVLDASGVATQIDLADGTGELVFPDVRALLGTFDDLPFEGRRYLETLGVSTHAADAFRPWYRISVRSIRVGDVLTVAGTAQQVIATSLAAPDGDTGYRTAPGQRVPEISSRSGGDFLLMSGIPDALPRALGPRRARNSAVTVVASGILLQLFSVAVVAARSVEIAALVGSVVVAVVAAFPNANQASVRTADFGSRAAMDDSDRHPCREAITSACTMLLATTGACLPCKLFR